MTAPSSSSLGEAFRVGFGVTVGVLFLVAIFIAVWYLRTRHLPTTANYSDDEEDEEESHVSDVVVDVEGIDADAVLSRGIDVDAVLSRFPKFVYTAADSTESSTSAVVGSSCSCAVCLADYADGDVLRLLPDCGHTFHASCVDPWLINHRRSTCPICRRRSAAKADDGSAAAGANKEPRTRAPDDVARPVSAAVAMEPQRQTASFWASWFALR
ncbi:unnamed protein product [Linum tenue]|uniref:RING-type domain-containing protein n=1 Tax=Linum tenue TaxID=586396 RepID=A0AAV0JN54_9ROSI|nr:unnamed protein product [Linum tenue]